jgi:hypothetical protein
MHLRLVAGMAITLSLACCATDSQKPGSPEAELSAEMPWAGFEASASSISVKDDGTFDRQLQLLNMPAGDSSKGLVLGVHPPRVASRCGRLICQ